MYRGGGKKIGPDLSVNSLLNILDRVSVGTGRGWVAAPEALAVSGLVVSWGRVVEQIDNNS